MASPLGLTFKVTDVGIPSLSGTNKTYKVVNSKAVKSLFVGGGQFSPFPAAFEPKTGSVTSMRNAVDVHNDEIYDTSITSIIDYCKDKPSMKLDYSDFAYLKNLGVYPNNRLMIARRFPAGVGNDLTSIQTTPLATLIGWVKDGEDFMQVSFNEVWTSAEASFEDVLNDIGKDVKASPDNKMENLGSVAARALDSLPLPGFMEGIQYEVMKKMGLSDAGIGNSPLGNPNLIREAKRRSTVEKGQPGSGLAASFTVKMTVEYEQKFINGIDPTIVYMDIIQNALTFGTSDSAFQFSSAFGTGTSKIIQDLISGDLAAIGRALADFVQSLLDAIMNVGEKLIAALIDPPNDDLSTDEKKKSIFEFMKTAFTSTIGHVISKYKIRLIGIANALTGSPSTPWHITIGNPKKPLFSSGDMLCGAVTLTVGKNLAFNDLPSYIKIEFDLTNARSLGAQEIFNRFNTGKGRSYVRFNKSFVETGDIDFSDPVTNTTTTGTGTQSVTTSKNIVTPKESKKEPDDYLIEQSKFDAGTDWLKSGVPPTDNKVRTGDDTTARPTSTTGTQPSQSSQNNPATPTANIAAGVTTPTPTIGSSPLSSQEISNGSGILLESRKRNIFEELKVTNPSDPKYNQLDQEYRDIRAEQSNRELDEASGIKRK
jgi:hypothetical protein